MLYFLYGEDSYRSKRKLEEVVLQYKKVHKSGLNLVYIDTKESSNSSAKNTKFDEFWNHFKVTPMFAEKKLIIIKNIFGNINFQESFLENIKNIEKLDDIVIVYEDGPADKRTKIYKQLLKNAKCQEFNYLAPASLKKWVLGEFEKNKAKIEADALILLISFVKNDLWRMTNEIHKLSNYKQGSVIKKEDIELTIKPSIESDIFKTIEALASKDKKKAISLLHKHIDNGDNPLYLLSMIAYQFRNLLIIKELQEKGRPYSTIAKSSGLHPFVVQKTYYLCNQFSFDQLKKIYRKIFLVDLNIKIGKIDPEIALDLLVVEI